MMKKMVLIVFLVIFVTACGKSEVTLLFSDKKSAELNEIGKVNEETKIYSKNDIQYKTNDGSISLKEALEKNMITIDKITSKMKKDMVLNDGGTITYTYEVNNNNLADKGFSLVKCKKINEERESEEDSYYRNQNIYIEVDSNSESIINYCDN